jgi:hypothetical protein
MQISPAKIYSNQNTLPPSMCRTNKVHNMKKDSISFEAKCTFNPEIEKMISRAKNPAKINELKQTLISLTNNIDDISEIKLIKINTPLIIKIADLITAHRRDRTIMKLITEDKTNKYRTVPIKLKIRDKKIEDIIQSAIDFIKHFDKPLINYNYMNDPNIPTTATFKDALIGSVNGKYLGDLSNKQKGNDSILYFRFCKDGKYL